MKDRIKEIRKVLGLTQEKFSERIGIKRNTIANYETGRNEPIDAVISLICREFSVSEAWLRTGEGEMFASLDADQKIAEYVGGLMDGKDTPEKRMFLLWIEMTDNEKELWLKMLQKMGTGLAGGSGE